MCYFLKKDLQMWASFLSVESNTGDKWNKPTLNR